MPYSISTTRRGFLRSATLPLFATAAGVGGYAWAVEPHWYEVVRRPMPLAGLPPQWQGRTLLHLSDLHVGAADEDFLVAALRQAAHLQADAVVVTGDFMSYYRPEQLEQVVHIVGELRRPPLGVYATFGNHDYGANWDQVRIADALQRRLDDVGVRVLRNESVEVDGLRFVGLEDMWCPRFDRSDVLRALRAAAGGPSVTLCHNPDACDLPIWRNVRGWVLAGHTHGGQCRPPFLPAPIVPVRNKRYSQGEVALGDGRTLYISRGLGYTQRIRFNVRPEMTLFTLQPA